MALMRLELRRLRRDFFRWSGRRLCCESPAYSVHAALQECPAIVAEQHLNVTLKGHFLRKSTHLYLICIPCVSPIGL